MSLGRICEFDGGSQPPKSEFSYTDKPGYVRFLQIRDFGSDRNITFIPISEKNRTCTADDIMIGRYGASVGKILTGKAGAYNVALMKAAPNYAIVSRSWFYYYLISDLFQKALLTVADRSAQAGFSKDDIYGFPVPIPPLPEQCRIVAILDEAFEAIAKAKENAERNLKNARALFKSQMNEVFTQLETECEERIPLEYLCAADSSITYGVVKPGREGSVAFVRGGDISQGTVLLNQLRTISSEISGHYRRTLLKGGELLISLVGQPGQVAIAPPVLAGANIARQVGLIRLNEQVNAEYVRLFLQSPIGQRALGSRQSGSVQQVINLSELRQVLVPVIPLKNQQQVANTLLTTSRASMALSDIFQSKLSSLSALRISILHSAFSGLL